MKRENSQSGPKSPGPVSRQKSGSVRPTPDTPTAAAVAVPPPVKKGPTVRPPPDWDADKAVLHVMKRRLVISEAGFQALRAYKYKGGAYTPLDNIFNARIWNPAAKMLPRTIAPNLITLFGLSWVIISFLVLAYFCPDFKGVGPRLVYLFAAICVFAYQVLDAIDGKQARDTDSASALGQLFDHGCDSLSTTFLTLSVATTINLGISWETMLLLFAVQFPFFLAQWQEYHTHMLIHAMGWMGVTEAQLITMSIHLFAALFGPEIYLSQLGPLRLNQWIVALQLVLGGFITVTTLYTVFSKASNRMEAASQLLPLVGLVCGGCVWASSVSDPSSHNSYQRHSVLTTCMLGLLFTHLSNQIIICALCRMPYPHQWILLPFPALLAIDYLRLAPQQADIALGMYLGVIVFVMGQYMINFIEEITHFLAIHCLRLGIRTEPADCKR